jgi:predicted nucleotidyltransferase
MSSTVFPSEPELRARRIAERRRAAVAAVAAAEDLARRAGGRLLVFGSLAEGGFHERSDIDVALFDVAPGIDSEVAAEIDTCISAAGFETEVVPERFLPPSLRARVLRHGREPRALG